MVNAAWQEAADNDVLLLLHDCARARLDDETKMIITKLAEQKQPAALVLNKIDLAKPGTDFVQNSRAVSFVFI